MWRRPWCARAGWQRARCLLGGCPCCHRLWPAVQCRRCRRRASRRRGTPGQPGQGLHRGGHRRPAPLGRGQLLRDQVRAAQDHAREVLLGDLGPEDHRPRPLDLLCPALLRQLRGRGCEGLRFPRRHHRGAGRADRARPRGGCRDSGPLQRDGRGRRRRGLWPHL